MALLTPLWMQNAPNPGYSANVDRSLLTANFGAGVVAAVSNMTVVQRAAGTNMSVDVNPGMVVVQGTTDTNQQRYLCRNTNVENVGLGAAPAPGTSRIDLIIAEVRDSAVVGGAFNDWVLRAVAGTASSGTPSVPTLPPDSEDLAQVTVAAGTAAITNAMITDRRAWAAPLTAGANSSNVGRPRSGTLYYNTTAQSLNVGLPNFGGWQNVLAGNVRMAGTSGALLGTPPAIESDRWRMVAGTQDVGFIGAGVLVIPEGLNGILNYTALPRANVTPIVITRSTHASLTKTQLPMRAWNVSDGSPFNGTAERVGFNVIGWT